MPGPAGCLALHPPGVGATNKVTGRKKSLLRAFRKVDGVTSFHPYAPEQEQSMIDNLAFSALALPANPLTGH